VKQVSLVPTLAVLTACGARISWVADDGEDDDDEGGGDGAGGDGGVTGVITLDGWLPFRATDAQAAAVMALRHRLQGAFERVVRGHPPAAADEPTVAAFRAAVSVDSNV